MLPGTLWNHEIVKNIDESDVFIFLVSQASITNYEISQIEMQGAIERTTKKSSNQIVPIIIPILLSATKSRNPLDKFLALPRAGKGIYDSETPDIIWQEVLSELDIVFAHIRQRESAGKV